MLCRALFPEHPYRTLEAPDERAFAAEDPRAFLTQFPDGAVIDEVQRVPELLSYLQGIIDKNPAPGRWVLSGSQKPIPAGIRQPVVSWTHRGASATAIDLGRDQTL